MTRTATAGQGKSTETEMSLFGPVEQPLAGVKHTVLTVRVDQIAFDPEQPRKNADPGLVASMKAEGFWPDRPVYLRPHPDPESKVPFMLIDGERRTRSAIAAGFENVYAIVAGKIGAHTDAGKRLIMQLSRNRGAEPLTPIEEANALKTAKASTGATLAQLEEATGIPKTTISDRLALAEAPAPFQPLFIKGVIGASAAPIVRKYADVPVPILEKGVANCLVDFRWARYTNDGKAVPNKEVEDVLEMELLTQQMQEVPDSLALLYQGGTVEIDGKKYATDMDEFRTAMTASKKAEQGPPASRAHEDVDSSMEAPEAPALAGTDDREFELEEEPAPAKAAAPRQTASQRKQAEKEQRAAEERNAFRIRLDKAGPAILAAIATEIRKAKAGASDPLGKFLLTVAQKNVGLASPHEIAKHYPGKINSADDLVRYIVIGLLIGDWLYPENREQFPRLLNEMGLKVDIKAIVDRVAQAKAAPVAKSAKAPAKAPPKKPSAKKPAKAKAPAKKKK